MRQFFSSNSRGSGNGVKYAVTINRAYLRRPQDCACPELPTQISKSGDADAWVANLPFLKEGVFESGYAEKEEVALEQQFIRTNNRLGAMAKTEVFIADRQYAKPGNRANRLDLIGVRRSYGKRERAFVPLVVEVKYALNPDIRTLSSQVNRYVDLARGDGDFVRNLHSMLAQRGQLGLYGDESELFSDGKFSISPAEQELEVIILLGDFNPHSSLLDLTKLQPSAPNVRLGILHTGCAVWEKGGRLNWL